MARLLPASQALFLLTPHNCGSIGYYRFHGHESRIAITLSGHLVIKLSRLFYNRCQVDSL
jgi:hypothetical protein